MEINDFTNLLKEFDSSSKATKEMLNSLEGFKEVLHKFYLSFNEIKQIKEEVEKSNVLISIEAMSTSLYKINENVLLNVNEVNNELNLMATVFNSNQETLNTSSKEIKKAAQDLSIVAESIEKINKLTGIIESFFSLNIDSRMVSFENSLLSMNSSLNNLFANLKDGLTTIDIKVSECENIVTSTVNQQIKTIDICTEKIENACAQITERDENINTNIEVLIKNNSELISLLDSFRRDNNNMYETFCNFADKWAEDSVHGIALKKKGK